MSTPRSWSRCMFVQPDIRRSVPSSTSPGPQHVPQSPEQADLPLALAGVAADAQVEDRPARQRDDGPDPCEGEVRPGRLVVGQGVLASVLPACRAWRPSCRRTGRRGGPSRATAGRPARPGSARRGGPRRRRTARAGASCAWQYAPVSALHGSSPRATRWAIRRATAARHDWSAARAWPRKTHSVTTGEKTRSSHRPTVASASVMTSSVRTSVNGRPPSWRNCRRRTFT